MSGSCFSKTLFPSLTVAATVAICSGVFVSAEDLKTARGDVYRSFEVTALSSGAVTIRHEGGVATVPLADLPDEVRKRFTPEQLFLRLQEKEREIETLRKQLAGASERMRENPVQTRSSATAAPAAARTPEPAPARPLETLPPLKPTDVVDAAELAEHYRSDRVAADRRYRSKVILVRGRIEQLAPKLLLRTYMLFLETPDRTSRVACQFSYADDFKSVITRDNETHLVARLSSGREVILARLNDVVTIRGTCAGMDGNAVLIRGCQRVP